MATKIPMVTVLLLYNPNEKPSHKVHLFTVVFKFTRGMEMYSNNLMGK